MSCIWCWSRTTRWGMHWKKFGERNENDHEKPGTTLAAPAHTLAYSADLAVLARRDRHADWRARADSVAPGTGGRVVRAQPYRSAHLQLLGQQQLGRKRSCSRWRNHLLLEDRR